MMTANFKDSDITQWKMFKATRFSLPFRQVKDTQIVTLEEKKWSHYTAIIQQHTNTQLKYTTSFS